MFFKHLKKLPALLASSVLLLAGYDPPTTTVAVASTSLLIPSPLFAILAPDHWPLHFVGSQSNSTSNATAANSIGEDDYGGDDSLYIVFELDTLPPQVATPFDIGSFDVEALEIIVPALLAVRGTVGTGSGYIAVSIVVEALKAALYLGGLEHRPRLGLSDEAAQVDKLLTGLILRLAINAVFGALAVLLGRRGRRRRRHIFKMCIGIVARELVAWTRGQSIILILAVVMVTQLRPASFAFLRDGLLLGCLVPRHVLKA